MADNAKKQDDNKVKRNLNADAIHAPKNTIRKPASFSKKAGNKAIGTAVNAAIDAQKKPENDLSFKEFETMKIAIPTETLESKIIIRDVAKEKPKAELVEEKKAVEEIISEPAPKKIVRDEETTRQQTAPKLSAKTTKDLEIKKALRSASHLSASTSSRSHKKAAFGGLGWTRVALAGICAVTAVFAIVYFVNLTSTDMSLKVAAMQSGIDATYPSYIPRGYSLSDVTSSSGKVSMRFKNEADSFSIVEENSTWDSDGLLNNYIKETYRNDYTVVREQGLTIYMGDSWAAWVNGGKLYKLTVDSGSLTKKQIKTIATSL